MKLSELRKEIKLSDLNAITVTTSITDSVDKNIIPELNLISDCPEQRLLNAIFCTDDQVLDFLGDCEVSEICDGLLILKSSASTVCLLHEASNKFKKYGYTLRLSF